MWGPGGSIDWTTCCLAVLSLLLNYKWTQDGPELFSRSAGGGGTKGRNKGTKSLSSLWKKISKVFGMSLGYSLGGSDLKNSTLSRNTAGAGHRRQVGFRVTENEGSTMIGGGRGTDGMVNKMGSENEDRSNGGDNRGRRWETAEDRSEPSETDEDEWDGWKTGRNC